MLCEFSFAQKRAVKDAKTAMKNNVGEARELIQQALKNIETKADPDTWKVAGDIEYRAFDIEKEKEMLQEFKGEKANEDIMYDGLYNLYNFYIEADRLGELPDEKGKSKNKVRKDVTQTLINSYPFFVNWGSALQWKIRT